MLSPSFFRHYAPHPALQQLITRIVISSFTFGEGVTEAVIPFPPQPEHCLYFYPHRKLSSRLFGSDDFKRMPQSMLVGPHVTRVDLKMEQSDTLVILVGFQPGGLHRLLGLPMQELLDKPVDASPIMGSEIALLCERLANTADTDGMSQLIQEYLQQKAARLKHALPFEEMLMQISQEDNYLNVDEMARGAFVSVRQLERQFKMRTGLSPKMYARLSRFSRAWLLHERNPQASWISIAHSCGYADQMHMIRDFKEFAGVSPGILHEELDRAPVRIQSNTFVRSLNK